MLGGMRAMTNEVRAIRGNRFEGLEFFDSEEEERFDSHYLLKTTEELKTMYEKIKNKEGFQDELVWIFFF